MQNENYNPGENDPRDEEQNYQPDPESRPRMSPVSAAFLGLLVVFILYQVGGSLLTLVIFGFDMKNADITAVRLMTSAGQILFILLPALIFTRLIYTDVTRHIRVKSASPWEIGIFSIGLLFLNTLLQSYMYIQNVVLIKLAGLFPVINSAKSYLDKVDKMVEDSYNSLLTSHSIIESVFIVIVVAVIPAVCEEVFFRGYVQKSFELRYKSFLGALITAVIFGLYHFHPYQIIPLAALGLYFGFAAYMSNSILVPIILHFLNNFIAVIMFFLYGSDDITVPKSISTADLRLSVIIFMALLAAFSVLIFLINRIFYKKSN
ncbi:MAG: type II CAAX prenyl endopeptidase Rce1 family protein [Ignavibacteriales bacterium]